MQIMPVIDWVYNQSGDSSFSDYMSEYKRAAMKRREENYEMMRQ